MPVPRDSFCSSTDSGLAVGSTVDEVQLKGIADEVNEISMRGKLYKPVELLGKPYDTSSPCLVRLLTLYHYIIMYDLDFPNPFS